MTNYAKVKEHKNLVREMYSKAILNTDEQALLQHRKNKSVLKNIMENNKKIEKLESDIGDIKSMLQSIIEKSKV
jgi:hypothetical protein